ncbi:MAG: dihydrofolate reductase [Verrucomicrobia bacterium]|nr:dihydrofolate reductase [Verrucomicrobiota bacterium]MDA1066871.1 dihydrofolate reductase [Verrucomicrobiota bacterium]
MKPIYMIVACAENRVIGKEGGGLPWSIPEDTAYWKEKVTGGVMIEGRRCFEELGGAFPDTDTIVLSRDPNFSPGAVLSAVSLPLAIELAQGLGGEGPIWLCGGPTVYQEGMEYAERLYLTQVHTEAEGVAYFPDWRSNFTVELERRDSSNADYSYSFLVLGRAK